MMYIMADLSLDDRWGLVARTSVVHWKSLVLISLHFDTRLISNLFQSWTTGRWVHSVFYQGNLTKISPSSSLSQCFMWDTILTCKNFHQFSFQIDGTGQITIKPDLNSSKSPYRIQTSGDLKGYWRIYFSNSLVFIQNFHQWMHCTL
jgi:hypothetical protein